MFLWGIQGGASDCQIVFFCDLVIGCFVHGSKWRTNRAMVFCALAGSLERSERTTDLPGMMPDSDGTQMTVSFSGLSWDLIFLQGSW